MQYSNIFSRNVVEVCYLSHIMTNSAHLFIYFTINVNFSSEITIGMVFCLQVNTELLIIFKF